MKRVLLRVHLNVKKSNDMGTPNLYLKCILDEMKHLDLLGVRSTQFFQPIQIQIFHTSDVHLRYKLSILIIFLREKARIAPQTREGEGPGTLMHVQ